jgi:hypothetical protein
MKNKYIQTMLGISIEVLYALVIMACAFFMGWGFLLFFK